MSLYGPNFWVPLELGPIEKKRLADDHTTSLTAITRLHQICNERIRVHFILNKDFWILSIVICLAFFRFFIRGSLFRNTALRLLVLRELKVADIVRILIEYGLFRLFDTIAETKRLNLASLSWVLWVGIVSLLLPGFLLEWVRFLLLHVATRHLLSGNLRANDCDVFIEVLVLFKLEACVVEGLAFS